MKYVTPSEHMHRPEVPHRLRLLCLDVEREIRKSTPGFCWFDVMERRRNLACQAFRVIVSVAGHDLGYSYPKIGACFWSGHVTAIDCRKRYRNRRHNPVVLMMADRILNALRPASGEEV